ncbi:MAG TPA: heme-binding protein [Xanthobacteraceae bacterium]|nr:heme-binding protein [Xanthobacteraceae bacterium]
MTHALKLVGSAIVIAAATLPAAGNAQVLMQRDVSLHMALTIAEAAIAECEKTGNSVSVAVLDRAGRLRVFLQGDKAAPHNIELAQRKAYTARTFGRTSAEWAERTGPNSELAGQRQLEHVIPLRGGVPIKVGDETIGAVGVSGSSSNGDEACAMAGVAKVADQLK